MRASYRFVEEILDRAAEDRERVIGLVRTGDTRPLVGERLPLRAGPLRSPEPV